MRKIFRYVAERRWLQVAIILALFTASATCLAEIMHVSFIVRGAWGVDGQNQTVESAHMRGTICFSSFMFFEVLLIISLLSTLRIGEDSSVVLRWAARLFTTAFLVPVGTVLFIVLVSIVYAVAGRPIDLGL